MPGDFTSTETVRESYTPRQDRRLSSAILSAIETLKLTASLDEQFVLSDYVDPDALDALFRPERTGPMYVEFVTDDVYVTVHGDQTVAIRVSCSDRAER